MEQYRSIMYVNTQRDTVGSDIRVCKDAGSLQMITELPPA